MSAVARYDAGHRKHLESGLLLRARWSGLADGWSRGALARLWLGFRRRKEPTKVADEESHRNGIGALICRELFRSERVAACQCPGVRIVGNGLGCSSGEAAVSGAEPA